MYKFIIHLHNYIHKLSVTFLFVLHMLIAVNIHRKGSVCNIISIIFLLLTCITSTI